MDLKLAQARYRFGLASGEDLAAAALELIEGGSDNPTACELACLHSLTLRDAGPLFERILREMHCPELPETEAQRLVAEDVATRVIAGLMRPRDGAAEIWELYAQSGNPEHLWPSAELRYAYDDDWPGYPGGRAAYNVEIDKQVVEAFRELLANRLPSRAC